MVTEKTLYSSRHEFRLRMEGKMVTIICTGCLDATSLPDFNRLLDRSIEAGGRNFLIYFGGLERLEINPGVISRFNFRVQREGGKLEVNFDRCSQTILDRIKAMRLEDILRIEPYEHRPSVRQLVTA